MNTENTTQSDTGGSVNKSHYEYALLVTKLAEDYCDVDFWNSVVAVEKYIRDNLTDWQKHLFYKLVELDEIYVCTHLDEVEFFVGCGDWFAYACADSEKVEPHELDDLYNLCRLHPYLGSQKWCTLKCKVLPIKERIQQLKNAGMWCEKLEELQSQAAGRMT